MIDIYFLSGYHMLAGYVSDDFNPANEYYTLHLFLFVLNLVSLIVGIYIWKIGYKAYKINKDKDLLMLCTGFLLIALSNIFEDLVLNFFDRPVEHAHLIRIPLFTLGMILILYSLKRK